MTNAKVRGLLAVAIVVLLHAGCSDASSGGGAGSGGSHGGSGGHGGTGGAAGSGGGAGAGGSGGMEPATIACDTQTCELGTQVCCATPGPTTSYHCIASE